MRMNIIDSFAPGRPTNKDAGTAPNSKSMATLLDTTSSLIGQAEALLGACRALLEQTRLQSAAGIRERELDEMAEQAAWLAERAGTKPTTSFAQPNHVLRGTPRSYAVDADALELFRSNFPSLPRGAAVVLVTLLGNCGRMVSHTELRAVLKTESLSSVKIHVSRIRTTLAQKSINAAILSMRGGYGMSTEAAEKLIDGLGLSASERNRLAAATIDNQEKDSEMAA